RRVDLPRRPLRADPRRGPPAEPRLRDGPPELRDVGLVLEPGAGAARAGEERRVVRAQGVRAAEEARRGGGAAAPRAPRRAADQALAGAGRVHRRRRGRAVQARPLPLLVEALRGARILVTGPTSQVARAALRALAPHNRVYGLG